MKNDNLVAFGGCGAFILLLVLGFTIGALMFQYNLYTITGKDVAWYLDMLGGVVFNGINVPVFVVSLIYRACGYPVPIVDNV